jgi:hypothetical protein
MKPHHHTSIHIEYYYQFAKLNLAPFESFCRKPKIEASTNVSLLYPRTKQIMVMTYLNESLNNNEFIGLFVSTPSGVIIQSVIENNIFYINSKLNLKAKASSSILSPLSDNVKIYARYFFEIEKIAF